MSRKRLIIFLGFFLFFITLFSIYSDFNIFGASNQMSWTIVDDNLEVYIVVEGVNVKEADNRIEAILIDPNGVVNAYAEITSIADNPIELDELKIAFIWANLDAFTNIQKLNSTIHPGSTLSANRTFVIEDYLSLEDLLFISGIYKFRYNIEYTVNNSTTQMKGDPFYMKIIGNPLETVTGAVATIAVASSGLSLLWVANSIRKVSPIELKASIDSSYAAPTNKLLSFYRGRSYKSVQNEISNAVYRQATSWKGDICPLCGTVWPENSNNCLKCEISIEEAQKLYSKALEDKSLKTSKEIVDSVSGLSLYNITQNLGEGVIPTTSIISVLTSAGLTLVEPRVSHRMSKKTRRLIFTSLSTALLSILWIQAVGIEVVSLTMLLIAILTGTIPAMLIRRALELNLKKKISNFFNQNTEI
jgi:hypothetical protein